MPDEQTNSLDRFRRSSFAIWHGSSYWDAKRESNLSKSLLSWPDETSARSAPDGALALAGKVSPPAKETISTVAEKPNHRADPAACCSPEIEDPDSFEARWRHLETRLVRFR